VAIANAVVASQVTKTWESSQRQKRNKNK
jgi:hypothetical protein